MLRKLSPNPLARIPPLKLVSHARRVTHYEAGQRAPYSSREVASQSSTKVDDKNEVAAHGAGDLIEAAMQLRR
jgi:hypothetical protein